MSDANSTGGEDGLNGEATTVSSVRRQNTVFEMLARHRRRDVIRTLRTTAAAVCSLTTLTESLRTHDPAASDLDRIRIELHHRTVPKLDEANVIDSEARTHTVHYRGSDVLEHLLDTIDDLPA